MLIRWIFWSSCNHFFITDSWSWPLEFNLSKIFRLCKNYKKFKNLTVFFPLQLEAELEMEDIMSLKDGLTKQEVSILPFLNIDFVKSACMDELIS